MWPRQETVQLNGFCKKERSTGLAAAVLRLSSQSYRNYTDSAFIHKCHGYNKLSEGFFGLFNPPTLRFPSLNEHLGVFCGYLGNGTVFSSWNDRAVLLPVVNCNDC